MNIEPIDTSIYFVEPDFPKLNPLKLQMSRLFKQLNSAPTLETAYKLALCIYQHRQCHCSQALLEQLARVEGNVVSVYGYQVLPNAKSPLAPWSIPASQSPPVATPQPGNPDYQPPKYGTPQPVMPASPMPAILANQPAAVPQPDLGKLSVADLGAAPAQNQEQLMEEINGLIECLRQKEPDIPDAAIYPQIDFNQQLYQAEQAELQAKAKYQEALLEAERFAREFALRSQSLEREILANQKTKRLLQKANQLLEQADTQLDEKSRQIQSALGNAECQNSVLTELGKQVQRLEEKISAKQKELEKEKNSSSEEKSRNSLKITYLAYDIAEEKKKAQKIADSYQYEIDDLNKQIQRAEEHLMMNQRNASDNEELEREIDELTKLLSQRREELSKLSSS